ncbi:MAG: type I restriction enzyme HsdR N-terminal domain-containing protein [Firmicutes bacterium]|nr:type I restriction enzyme HsdR N-terminal domain-containing protein [Bacillota bacterium]
MNLSDPATFSLKYADLIKKLHSVYSPMKSELDDEYKQLNNLYSYIANHNGAAKYKKISNGHRGSVRVPNRNKKETNKYCLFDDVIRDLKQVNENENGVFESFIYDIASLTTYLAISAPDLYIPYYFKYNFNVLKIIADTFNIELPVLPQKSDYNARLKYYVQLCDALHYFRTANNLSPFELYAFLYDFAPNYIGGLSSYIITELPKPKGAYFIGGAKDDIFLSDNTDKITIWQCNLETKVGDMIVMYLRSPISAIDSVWRSCSVGFIDPFFYYYRCTYICSPQKLKQVKLEQMRLDKIIGTMPIVRKNMQGLNGIELKPSEYNHLLELGNSNAIRLEYSAVNSEKEYSTEKEVEDNVVKPLLEKIGYDKSDYSQQLYLEIGNHNYALIPDFVLFPKIIGNHKTAFAVVEAKRSITTLKSLNAAKSQVRSYAKLLGTKYAAVISQEKIWIYSSNDDYYKEIFSCCISELSNDLLYELRKIIGKP